MEFLLENEANPRNRSNVMTIFTDPAILRNEISTKLADEKEDFLTEGTFYYRL